MNEFIAQFVVESRELVEQAMDDLMALERAPGDKARLDSAFRAFHTLKGGASIVEFAAMSEALHGAESALAAARTGQRAMSAAAIADFLACLDQVAKWLDATERAGSFPADAGAQAAGLVRRFAPAPQHDGEAGWAQRLLKAHPQAAAAARAAVRYAPGADAFFAGEDPLARISSLPGLLVLDIAPVAPWPALDALDPFACNIVLKALLRATAAETSAALGEAAAQCVVEALQPDEGPMRLAPARELLEAQLALLEERAEPGFAGRLASAGVCASRVLRCLGKTADAERIARVAAGTDAESLSAEIRAVVQQLTPQSAQQDVALQTLRVDAARIDALVALTGELTVVKNAIGHAAKLAERQGNSLAGLLKSRQASLERLTAELQRSVLGLRVVPLRNAFQRFPRLIRDMAAQLRKPATLLIEGEDTEADKAIVEMIVEPILHVLRNAMDHGIEEAPARSAAGKPAVATLRLSAARRGDNVVLEISDDGRGIDLARVRQVARERGIAPAETVAAMGERELIELVFAPGFSTASRITAVSGRGVGMDAVRTAVKRLGGQVELASEPGKGTTVRFMLPYSVIVSQVMTVRAGEQVFGIPLEAIVETVRVPASRIAPVGSAQAVVLRDRTIPVVALAGVLGLTAPQHNPTDAILVVAKVNGGLGALQVDGLGERMEIMLKPLDGLLSGMPGIAGSTLLGDGSVLLVLDLAELLQ